MTRRSPGVIYASSFTRQVEVPKPLAEIPTVLLNCYSSEQVFPTVLANDVSGGFLATQHLILYGHRRIAVINGEQWMDASQDRLKGYRQALAAAGIEFDAALVKIGDWSVRSGYVRTLALMKLDRPPTAFYCANDLMAWGCLQALARLGKSVPEDVSVVGHNDVEVAANTVPPLTTCRPRATRWACRRSNSCLRRRIRVRPARTSSPPWTASSSRGRRCRSARTATAARRCGTPATRREPNKVHEQRSVMANDLDELVPQFLTIATGNISDALFELGIEPCSVPGPTALVPGQPRFAGPAFHCSAAR